MPSQFGTAYTLGQGTGTNFEYLRQHTWEVYIGSLDTALLAKSVVIPQTKITVGELYHANERVKYPKLPTPGDLVVEFYDAINPGLVNQLDAWFNQIYNPTTGRMQITSATKRQGQVILYDPEWNPIRTWTCQGLFPQHAPVPDSALDYSSQDPVIIKMSFSCDRAFQGGSGSSTNTSGNNPIA